VQDRPIRKSRIAYTAGVIDIVDYHPNMKATLVVEP
jgi:hypothetical protein